MPKFLKPKMPVESELHVFGKEVRGALAQASLVGEQRENAKLRLLALHQRLAEKANIIRQQERDLLRGLECIGVSGFDMPEAIFVEEPVSGEEEDEE